MKLSLEDKLKRGFLFFCGAFFAIPTYILWKEVIVEHQWPGDFNDWLGLLMMPAFTIVSLLYAIFYRRVKAVDDRMEADMNNNTRRGKVIYAILMSSIFILVSIQILESHFIKHEPVQTWEYVAVPLMLLIWIGGLVFIIKVDDEQLHNFLVKNNLHWLDRLLYK